MLLVLLENPLLYNLTTTAVSKLYVKTCYCQIAGVQTTFLQTWIFNKSLL